MKKFMITVLACATLVTATAMAEAAPGTSPSGRYNILGLTLGMTAKQAESLITQRLHVHPGDGSCSVEPDPGVYVPGRPFASFIFVKLRNTKLFLFFTEIPRGGGQEPEELWSIDYVPVAPTTADKAAFAAHIHEKFGPPTKVFSKQVEYWANKDFINVHDFDTAYTPVLNLMTYSGELTLKNFGILARNQSLFESQRTPHHPLQQRTLITQ